MNYFIQSEINYLSSILQNILQDYLSSTKSLKYSYSWINDDLRSLLFRTQFGKDCYYDLSDDDKKQFMKDFHIFYQFDDIYEMDEDNLDELKDNLLKQLSYFTRNEIDQLEGI